MILQLAPVHRQDALEAEKATIAAMAKQPDKPEMLQRKKRTLVKALRRFSQDYILPAAVEGGLHPLYHAKKLVSLHLLQRDIYVPGNITNATKSLPWDSDALRGKICGHQTEDGARSGLWHGTAAEASEQKLLQDLLA